MLEHDQFGVHYATIHRADDPEWSIALYNADGTWHVVSFMREHGLPEGSSPYWSRSTRCGYLPLALKEIENHWEVIDSEEAEAEQAMQDDIPERNYPARF